MAKKQLTQPFLPPRACIKGYKSTFCGIFGDKSQPDMLKNALLIVILALFTFACKLSKPVLPSARPSDFKLDYHLDGGMSDYSVDINIFSDSCHFRKRQEGKVLEKTIKLSPAELNSVYDLVKKNEFDKIEFVTDKGIVYDRGGESITVKWDNRSIAVSNAQNNFVKEKWFEKWKMLCEGLDGFVVGKAKQANYLTARNAEGSKGTA